MKIICLDPGHGGKDPGATGGGVLEKDIALDVSKKIRAYLQAAKCSVILTRENDTFISLGNRAAEANMWGADLFVSVHCNSADNASAHGMEVYVHTSRGRDSTRAAHAIYDRLLPASGLKGRGVKSKDLAVLRETSMPAVLVELGFISNPIDRAKLTNLAWQDDAAKAIADGIVEAIGKR